MKTSKILLGLSMMLLLSINLGANDGCKISAISILEGYEPECRGDEGLYRLAFKIDGESFPNNFDELLVRIDGVDYTANVCDDAIGPDLWLLLICNLPQNAMARRTFTSM